MVNEADRAVRSSIYSSGLIWSSAGRHYVACAWTIRTNHPFVEGNKRIGHAAMEVFLVLNGVEIEASVDEGVRLSEAR